MRFPSKSTAYAFLACVVIVFAWFSPWWIWGQNLAPQDVTNEMMRPWRTEGEQPQVKNHFVSDGADQSIVYRMVAAENYRREGWVGWSSLTYGGTAQYANTMSLYYDWTMQLHRWFDFWTAWNLGLLLQVLLAMGGMFCFLRGRGMGLLWVSCGALAYAANSQFAVWIYHRWGLGSFCWVPWILWAIDNYRRGQRWSWPLVPIFIGMAFLGGTLQHAVFVVLAVTAIWGEECWKIWTSRSTTKAVCSTTSPIKSGFQLTGRYAVWGILGVGMATMMFWPCIDAFLKSNRLHLHTGMYGSPENGIYIQGWLQPLFNLAAYPLQIFPSVLGKCNSIDVLKAFKSDLFFVAYFGSLPVLIGFLSLWRKKTPPLARILIAMGLLLPLTPLVRLLYQRLFMLFIFGGIIAFLHFMEHATRETKLKVFRIVSYLVAAGTVAWTALSVVLYLKPGLLGNFRESILARSRGSSFGYFTEWMGTRVDSFIHDLLIWSPQQLFPLILLVLALIGLRWSSSLEKVWKQRGNWLMVAVVVAEVTLFASRWVVWTDPQRLPLFPTTPESAAVQEIVGHEGRVTTLIHPDGHMACTPFIPNTLSAYRIATITGYDSIVPDGMIIPNESPGEAEKLGRFGVSHLITYPGNPDVPAEWKQVWSSPSMDLYENTLAFPRTMGFRTTADKDAFFAGSRPEIVRIPETTGQENRRVFEVPGDVTWIRVAENEDDGWAYQASPSTGWKEVQRAPDASMLMEIGPSPDGQKRLAGMRYDPPARKLGFTISAISLLLLIPLQWFVLRRPGKQEEINFSTP